MTTQAAALQGREPAGAAPERAVLHGAGRL